MVFAKKVIGFEVGIMVLRFESLSTKPVLSGHVEPERVEMVKGKDGESMPVGKELARSLALTSIN